MDHIDNAYHNIKMVLDNDYGAYQTVQELARLNSDPSTFAYALQDFYEAAIFAVLNESPPSMIGYMLISEQCLYHSIQVFDMIAADAWEANNWGNCDRWECRKRYDRSDSEDHCGNCGCCHEHCECSDE